MNFSCRSCWSAWGVTCTQGQHHQMLGWSGQGRSRTNLKLLSIMRVFLQESRCMFPQGFLASSEAIFSLGLLGLAGLSEVQTLTAIGQLHVSIGILMKFVINVTSRLGSLVARRNVLAYMGKSRCHRLNFAPLHNYTVCAI